MTQDANSLKAVDSMRLDGKTAVVTGASSGIGRAIALRMAAAGADVVVHAGSNREAADTVAEMMRTRGVQTQVVIADISDAGQCEALVESAFGLNGSVDVWVNNAGADVLTGPAAQWSFEEKLSRLWAVDVMGTITLSRSAAARMQEGEGGVILNLGWDQAASGQGGDSGEFFSATKGAIMAFSRSLAKSCAPKVRVNCLAPGWIQTSWGDDVGGYWDQRARGESLLERWGSPEDVANAALFLASPAGAFVNGQVLPINGGAQPWPSQLTRRDDKTSDHESSSDD